MRVKLGGVCYLKAGKGLKASEISKEMNENQYPCYGGNGLRGFVDKYTHEGTFNLIGRQGALCGNVQLVKGKFYATEHAVVVQPLVEMDSKWLFYKLTAMNLNQYSTGAAQPGLNIDILSKLEMSIPDILEQKHSAAMLDRIDDLITLRKQQFSKLDELVKARFVELFGDKGYPEDTLLNLCNIIDYRGKTPEKVEYGLPFITAKNVRMHQMNLEPREYISKETYDKVMVRGFPKEGDVVFTTEAPLGNVCRIPHFDTEFYIGQRIVTLQTEKLEPIYLEYALSSDDFKTKYMGKSSGSTVTGIRVRLLEQLTIPVPPRELQEQFAAFVEQTDKSKLVVQKSLDQLETLKKALMQQYFG